MTIVRALSRIFLRNLHSRAYWRLAVSAVMASAFSLPQPAQATTVRMITTLGTIDIQLYDDQAPITVANFLRYAGSGFYSSFTSQGAPAVGFIHRSATINIEGVSVIQGGGYYYSDLRTGTGGIIINYVGYSPVPKAAPIQNEFSPSRSNVRGKIAMAKSAGNPDSATSEWYINLGDNSAALDDTNNNGGFTVFGEVISGMNYVDAIGNLSVVNTLDPSFICSTPCSLSNLPISALYEVPVLSNYNPSTGLDPSNLVSVTSIPNVKSAFTLQGNLMTFTADVDMTFVTALSFNQDTSKTFLKTFTPPPGKTALFSDGIFGFTMTGALDPTGRVVTLHNDDPATANHYYAYGSTSDNPDPHWYDFAYDGQTGAEFVGNKILLHFVDGQRGDNDLNSTNGSIAHIGAPVLVADTITGSTKSSGCSIAAKPSQMTGNGDWVVISMFLAFVALVRRRARR